MTCLNIFVSGTFVNIKSGVLYPPLFSNRKYPHYFLTIRIYLCILGQHHLIAIFLLLMVVNLIPWSICSPISPLYIFPFGTNNIFRDTFKPPKYLAHRHQNVLLDLASADGSLPDLSLWQQENYFPVPALYQLDLVIYMMPFPLLYLSTYFHSGLMGWFFSGSDSLFRCSNSLFWPSGARSG
jgi:hypothetical protein